MARGRRNKRNKAVGSFFDFLNKTGTATATATLAYSPQNEVISLAQSMDWLTCFNAYDNNCIMYQEAAKTNRALNPTDPVGAIEGMYGASYDLTADIGREGQRLADGSVEFVTGKGVYWYDNNVGIDISNGIFFIGYSRSDTTTHNGTANQVLFGCRQENTTQGYPAVAIRNNANGFIVFGGPYSASYTATSGVLLTTPQTHVLFNTPNGGDVDFYINGALANGGASSGAGSWSIDAIGCSGAPYGSTQYQDHREWRFFGCGLLGGNNTVEKVLALESALREVYGDS